MEENLDLKEKEKAEEAMIQEAFQDLLNCYLATKHRKRVEIITKAFNFANQAHKGIKRRSGEPYILHPIAVAKIVCTDCPDCRRTDQNLRWYLWRQGFRTG